MGSFGVLGVFLAPRTAQCSRCTHVAMSIGLGVEGSEKRTQRGERKSQRLGTVSQARPRLQQGRSSPRPGVVRFTSGKRMPDLAPPDRTRGSFRPGRPHLKGGRTATRTTPPCCSWSAHSKEAAGRLRPHGRTQLSDVRRDEITSIGAGAGVLTQATYQEIPTQGCTHAL